MTMEIFEKKGWKISERLAKVINGYLFIKNCKIYLRAIIGSCPERYHYIQLYTCLTLKQSI